MAANLPQAPAGPARTFRQALQAVWLAHMIFHATGNGNALGRVDQYAWPYLEADLQAAQNIVVGGLTPEGWDSTNPLTHLLLESCRRNRMTNPLSTVRLHRGSPDEMVRYVCEVLRDGGGMPALINDGQLVPTLARLLVHTDLVLYDLKLMDEAAHRRWVGAPNGQILGNAAQLAEQNVPVQVRVPPMPGCTDTEENLRRTFEFMRRVGLQSVALLPYNAAVGAKYEWLGLPYEIQGTPQSAEDLRRLLGLAQEYELDASIG